MNIISLSPLGKDNKETHTKIPNIDIDNSSELVIGLVGAVGTNLDLLKISITEMLKAYSYDVKVIRISKDIISQFCSISNSDDNYKKQMN